MTPAPVLRALASLTALALLSSCGAQRRAAGHAAIEKEPAQEMKRICALPPAEREAELEKVNRETGIVVVCGKD